MNRPKAFLLAGLLAVALGGLMVPGHFALADENDHLTNRSLMRTLTGNANITIASDTYTNWVQLVTLTPTSGEACQHVKFVLDLDKATTGFATANTSQTIQLAVGRKVDGTNWRTSANLASAAISGTNAAKTCCELEAYDVGPTEAVRVFVKLSATSGGNVVIPYVCYYESGAAAVTSAAQ